MQETLAQRVRGVELRGRAGSLLRAADDGREEPRARRLPARAHGAQVRARSSGGSIESEWTLRPALDAMFLPDALKDDELRMMFSCCHPRLQRGRASRARASSAVRARRGRDRERVPRVARGHGEAPVAGQEAARGVRAPVRAHRGGLRAAPLRGPSRALPALQRGLPRRARARRRPRGSVPRGDAPRAASRGPRAGGDAGDVRARRADVAARGAPAGAHRRGGQPQGPLRAGPIAMGRGAPRRRDAAPRAERDAATRSPSTTSRPESRGCTRLPAAHARRAGGTSWSSTTS